MPGEFDDLIPEQSKVRAALAREAAGPEAIRNDELQETTFPGFGDGILGASVPDAPADRVPLGLDLARATGRGLQRAAAGIAGFLSTGDIAAMATQAGQQARKTDLKSFEALGEGSLVGGFDSEDIGTPLTSERMLQAIESISGQIPEPQTLGGKLAESGVEFGAGAAAFPFGSGVTALRTGIAGAVSGIGSESLGQLFRGTKLEPVARLFGAFGGGIAGATAVNRVPSARSLVREATKNVTTPQFTESRALQRASETEGVPLLGPEALESRPLQQLAEDVAATRSGRVIFDQATRQRPQQVQQAVNRQLNSIGTRVTPSDAGTNAQSAARSVIDSAQRERNAAVRRFLDAANDVEIPRSEIDRVRARLRNMSAKRRGPLDVELKSLRTRLTRPDGTPETNAAVIESTVQDVIQRSRLPGSSPNAIEVATRRALNPIVRALNKSVEKNVTPVRQSRRLAMQISQRILAPLLNSPIARIAESRDFQQAVRIAIDMVADPATVRPEDLKRTFRFLGRVDSNVPASFVRIHLENAFDQAARDIATGKNRAAGSVFRNAVFGTKLQRANIRAMLDELDRLRGLSVGTTRRAFENTMKTLDRTGRISNRNASTTRRSKLDDPAVNGGADDQAERVGEIVKGGLTGLLIRFAQDVIQGRNNRELARLFTAPDSVGQIELIARTPDPGARMRALVTGLSTARAAQQVSEDRLQQ